MVFAINDISEGWISALHGVKYFNLASTTNAGTLWNRAQSGKFPFLFKFRRRGHFYPIGKTLSRMIQAGAKSWKLRKNVCKLRGLAIVSWSWLFCRWRFWITCINVRFYRLHLVDRLNRVLSFKTTMCIYYSWPNTTSINWTVKGMAKMAIWKGVRQFF